MAPENPYLKYLWGDLNPKDNPEIQISVKIEPQINSFLAELKITLPSHEGSKVLILRENIKNPKDFDESRRSALQQLARKMAPQLFEVDPRIGMSIMLGDQFPSSVLFDRVDENPKMTAIAYERGTNRMGSCPFCEAPNDGRSRWCGGTLRWAHAPCTPWLSDPGV